MTSIVPMANATNHKDHVGMFGRVLSRLNGFLNVFSSIGLNLCLVYLFVSHFLPGLYYALFKNYLTEPWRKEDIGISGLLFIAVVLMAMVATYRFRWVESLASLQWPIPVASSLASLWRLYETLRIVPALVFLTAAMFFVYADQSGYRYAGEGVSTIASPLIFGMLFIMPWVMADLLVQILRTVGKRAPSSVMWRLTNIIMAIAWTLSIDGLANAVVAAIFLYFAFLPTIFCTFVLTNVLAHGEGSFLRRLGAHLLAIVALLTIVGITWNIGDRVKYSELYKREAIEATFKQKAPGGPASDNKTTSGQSQAADRGSASNFAEQMSFGAEEIGRRIQRLWSWLPERLSVDYYSFVLITNDAANGRYSPAAGWEIISTNIQYRLRSLLGLQSRDSRPAIRSIAQLNFYQLLPPEYANDRSGASPGMLGSFSYLLPWPADIVAAIAYILMIATLFTRASGNRLIEFSIVGFLILFALARSLFPNPADYFLILDPGFIFFVVFVVLVEAQYAVNHEVQPSFGTGPLGAHA